MGRGRQFRGNCFDRAHLLRCSDRVERVLDLLSCHLAAYVAGARLCNGGALRDDEG